VPESHWEGPGPAFTLSWGGRPWTLGLDGAEPGLRWEGDGKAGCLLSLVALRAAARFGSHAFTAATLVGFELHRDRVLATYAPPDWGGLTVRAAWSKAAAADAVDLEVQASATSVGKLFGLEVEVFSQWIELGREPWSDLTWKVAPRDIRSAALSYDGRETARVLSGLTTLPIAESSHVSLRPRIFAPAPADQADLYYVELVQPNDVARRIIVEPVEEPVRRWSLFTRYGLFGHDLEKGVVLRARLRGCWIRSQTPEDDARRLHAEFLREPLPLGP
jgi:hypothetical protein